MKKLNNESFKFLSLAIGILATIMILLPVLVFRDSETSFTGLEVAFGTEFANLGSWVSGEIQFNPIVLLAFMLPIASSLIILFVKKGYLISAILFIVAAALIFMIPEFTTVTVTILGNVNEINVEWNYGIGLIIAGILSILGSILSVVKAYMKF
jgi:hypothetical protein